MAKLPQKPRQHVLETESRNFVRGIFPSEWNVADVPTDYGIDLDIEIVEKTNVTGVHFSMQLKSTDEVKATKDGFISYSCKTSTLRYFLEKIEHVVFLVYDAKKKTGYWIWVKDYLVNDLSKNKKWKKQTTATIKIPKSNLFTSKSVEQIKTRVMHTHRQAKLLNTIQLRENPYIRYALQVDGNKEVITMSSKYPGAERDYPLTFDFKFNFDKSPDAQLSHRSLQDAMKKGLPAVIDGKFIESAKFPDLLDPETLGYDEFKPDKMFIVPISQNRKFSAAITILDRNDNVLFHMPFVEFREKRYGTDEIVFTNDAQQLSIRFSLTLNLVDHSANISFRTHFMSLNVFQASETLKFQNAFATGSWFYLVNTSTNTPLIKTKIPENVISQPPSILIDVASNLAHIQEKTGQIILWPDQISYEEKDLIDEIVAIIDTGVANAGNQIGFSLEKNSVQNFATSFSKESRYNFRIEANERYVNLFGQKIVLGSASIMLLGARPNDETATRLTNLSNLPDGALVQIELEVDDPGIKIYHHKWLPSHVKDSLNLKFADGRQDSPSTLSPSPPPPPPNHTDGTAA